MATCSISNSDDIIDMRDIIARIEELEGFKDDPDEDIQNPDSEDAQELAILSGIMDELKGYGGDEQWRGDWYPLTLIRDSYFEDYAEELAEDIGAIDRKLANQWPYTCIDWERATKELQMDYTSIDFDGVEYWARS